MCYVACREIEINAVVIAPTSQHFEIDERCTYPGCTVCLMYCPAEGSIVETTTGRSMVPPPEVGPKINAGRVLDRNDLNGLNVLNDLNLWSHWNGRVECMTLKT
jgi:hypothetical protein